MKKIYLSPPDVGAGERQLLLDAFDSGWIAPLGPHVNAFEQEFAGYLGVPHAVALSSGTAALHLALQIAGVRAGADVITSTLTFAATANAICYVGANPVFLDVQSSTWTMDPELLEEELLARHRRGNQAAAVVPVDLYGQCADYARIEAVCERYGVPVVADAAESLGASYRGKRAGRFGSCAAFSFNGNKIITTSGGGMLVSHDRRITDRARHLATQAREPAPHYQHEDVGYNYRMSNLLAAVGRGQLESLPDKLARRRQVNGRYREQLAGLPGLDFMPEAPYGRSNCWLTCITIDPSLFGSTREDVRRYLDTLKIEARPVWKPMHQQPVFRGCAVRGGRIAQRLFEHGLCLPSGSNLSAEDQGRVVAAVFESRLAPVEIG
jgi:pyridoxal phosphate-dependent aminotransferase EpsN